MTPLRVLTVGSLIPRKRHAWSLETCRALVAQGRAVEWRIVGRGPLDAVLRAAAPAEVTFIPFAERLRPLFEWADVFVLPSCDEGLGMVYLESALCGTPFVCAAGEGGAEVASLTGAGVALDLEHDPETRIARLAAAAVSAAALKPLAPERLGAVRRLTDEGRIRAEWRGIEAELTGAPGRG